MTNHSIRGLTGLTVLIVLFVGGCGALRGIRPDIAPTATSGISSDLEGTDWTLVALDSAEPLVGTRVTLSFTGGQARGSTGCNSYWATYVQNGLSLDMAGLAVTEMACLDPPGVMAQEQRYLDLLRATATYRIAGRELSLETDAGQTLRFAAATDVSPTETAIPQAAVPPVTEQPETVATAPPPPTASPTPIGGSPPSPTASPTPIGGSPPSPTASPTPIGGSEHPPTSVDQESSGPTIHYFRADLAEANPGDTIVLAWASTGGVTAILYHLPPSGQLPHSGWEVAPTGQHNYQISPEERNLTEFFLFVSDESGGSASANLGVVLRCPDQWFFRPAPSVCGSRPVRSQAAEEHFQAGTMIWVAERDTIIVLYDDGASPMWEMYSDDYDEGDPALDAAIVPPEGLHQPIRGFGLLWRNYAQIRDRLGWALDRESGFETVLQTTTRYKYNSTYLRGLDGNVWHLGPERSSWEKIWVTDMP